MFSKTKIKEKSNRIKTTNSFPEKAIMRLKRKQQSIAQYYSNFMFCVSFYIVKMSADFAT